MRDAGDRYYTPHGLAVGLCRAVVDTGLRRPRRILEPCAGQGAITRAAREVWPGASVDESDPDPEAGRACQLTLAELAAGARGPYDLVVTNPPFAGYRQHVANLRRLQARVGAARLAIIVRETAVAHLLDQDPPTWSYRSPLRPRWNGPGGAQYQSPDVCGAEILVWEAASTFRAPTVMRRLPDWRPRGKK